MEQEHRITYKAGITRTPSDFLCADGELAECINLATDTEELKPMVQPVEYMQSAGGVNLSRRVLYVHKYNSEERYISFVVATSRPAQYYLSWGIRETEGVTHPAYVEEDTLITYESADDLKNIKISSIGKTLIVADKDGMHYFLWKESSYKPVGELPSQDFQCWLVSEGETRTDPYDHGTIRTRVQNTGNGEGIIGVHSDPRSYDVREQEDYNNLITGLYAKNLKEIANKKGFCKPFFIRTALEMYDGTYTHISQPILMFPCVRENSYAKLSRIYGSEDSRHITLYTNYAKLYFSQSQDFSDWSDVVKSIAVFVSPGVDPHLLNIDQFPNSDDDETATPITCKTDGVFRESESATLSTYVQDEYTINLSVDNSYWFTCQPLRKKESKDLINDIKAESIFYKICEIGIKPETNKEIASYIDTYTLENITTQEHLEYDDYFSFCPLHSAFLYSYNSRLNMANVERGFFNGFDFFMPWDWGELNYDIYVTIETESGDVVVNKNVTTKQRMGIYFFYPDPRAKKVVIIRRDNDTKLLDANLVEHPRLNGAYYFAGLPASAEPERERDAGGKTNVGGKPEKLGNYIIQSEVNNPWVFKAEGYNKVGTGEIIGMSTISQALSQGQFGQFPLLVFSKSGVWAMSVNGTGLYLNIVPKSREVCINPNSIIQTDGAVFFVSKRGLIMITGDGETCVSERMNGATFNTSTLSPLATGTDWAGIVSACQTNRSFLEFIRDPETFMAYDYIDSRLLIINPDNTKYGFAYAYNIPDGTISKTILPTTMWNAINDYPDYLLQGIDDNVYSFYEKPREEEVEARTLAFLLTRPMKLAGPVSQASLRQLMNVGTWDKGTASNPLSCVKTEVYVSSDQKEWHNDISRFGAAARYYRLALYIKMLPTERLSGTIITEQQRRMNNMR